LEIQIQYAIRIKAFAHKGLIDILSDHWTNYDQYNKGKFITLAASTKNFFEQDIPPLQNPRTHTIPPWHYKEPNVDTFLSKLFTKDDTDPHIIKTTSLAYLENFSKNLFIFTDGSKDSNHNTGFAYTIPSLNINYRERLPTHASVFTSELLALRAALKYIKLQELKNYNIPPVTILSDSKSALEAIQKPCRKSKNNYILDIQELITLINTKVTFTWIPSHVGIEGNERADILAKEATQLNSKILQTTLTHKQLTPFVTQYINKLWQAQWDNSPDSHYKQLYPQVSRDLKTSSKDRHKEVQITRLRLGKCKFNHYLHQIQKHSTGLCRNCNSSPETIEHVFTECNTPLVSYVKDYCNNHDLSFTINAILSSTTLINLILNEFQLDI
jgi:ribonuclease HI